MEDEWRARLADQLLGTETPIGDRATFTPDAASYMEIAFGKARSELSYVLGLGRSHSLPVAGSVTGDEVWIRLGDAELRFALDRAAKVVRATADGQTRALTWDPRQRAIATSDGKLVDMEFFVRESIEATVKKYKDDVRRP
jgi:hypothetical protein